MANKTLTKPSVIRRTTNDVAAVDDHSPRTFAMIDGKEVEYDCCSTRTDSGNLYNEITGWVYLGMGTISRYDSYPSVNRTTYLFYRRIQTT